jgi:hypothetical protein
MQVHKVPTNWAHNHSPPSYGKRGYKEGHVPIGWLANKVIRGDDHGHQIQSRSDHRSRWAILQV